MLVKAGKSGLTEAEKTSDRPETSSVGHPDIPRLLERGVNGCNRPNGGRPATPRTAVGPMALVTRSRHMSGVTRCSTSDIISSVARNLR